MLVSLDHNLRGRAGSGVRRERERINVGFGQRHATRLAEDKEPVFAPAAEIPDGEQSQVAPVGARTGARTERQAMGHDGDWSNARGVDSCSRYGQVRRRPGGRDARPAAAAETP